MGIALAALSAFMFGTADFAGGLASRRNALSSVLVYSQVAGVALSLVAAPLLGSDLIGAADLAWGAAAGVTGAFGLAMLYRGLSTGIVAIVSPTAAVVGAAVPVVVGSAIGQAPSTTGWLGIAIALPAIFLLGWEPTRRPANRSVRKSLLHGVLAGCGFGAFYILISFPSPAAGLWPLVAARVASLAAVAGLAVATGRRLRPPTSGRALVFGGGLLDMGANIAFVLSTRVALLPLVSVVSSLYPAPTVVLGAIVLGQRLNVRRTVGLVLAVGGVILMSL